VIKSEGCAEVLSSQTSPHEGELKKCDLLVPLHACQLYIYSNLSTVQRTLLKMKLSMWCPFPARRRCRGTLIME